MNLATERQRTPEFLRSVRNAGVTGAVAICNNLDRDWRVYAKRFGIDDFHVLFTVGHHPHYAKSFRAPKHVPMIQSAVNNGQAVFVGETGLDYHRMLSPRDAQIDCFQAQLDIATRTRTPLYLHCRESESNETGAAWADFYPRLQAAAAAGVPGGVVHVWTLGAEPLQQLCALGPNWFIGATWKSFKQRHLLRRDLFEQRVLLETDAPYFGQNVIHTADLLAKFIHTTGERVMAWSDANLQKLLRCRQQ